MEDRTKEKPRDSVSDGSFQLPLLGPIRKAAKPLEDEIIKTAPAVAGAIAPPGLEPKAAEGNQDFPDPEGSP